MKKAYWLVTILLILSACSSSKEVYEEGVIATLDEEHATCIFTDEFGVLTVPTCDDLGRFKVRDNVEVLLMPTDKTNVEKVFLEFIMNGEKKEMPVEEYAFPTIATRIPRYLGFNVFFLSENNIYVLSYQSYETFHHFDGTTWTTFDLRESMENNVPDHLKIAAMGVYRISTNYIALPVAASDGTKIKSYYLMRFSTKDYNFVDAETYSEKNWEDWQKP